MRRLAAMLAVPLLAAAGAPVLVPVRDVAITYRVERDGRVLEQHVRWSVAPRRLRIDPPTPGMFVLVDYDAHRLKIVRDAARSFTDMPAPAGVPGLAPAEGRYVRGAEDEVAGLRCTEWSLSTESGPSAICVTDDGVLLRVGVGGRVVATASAVSYGAQDPAVFRVPDGYVRVEPPR